MNMQVMTNETLFRAAPSIFANEPWEGMTERYKFVPTIKVVDLLRDKGFLPVKATQSNCRIPGKAEFTKHMIRFRHEEHHKLAVEAIQRKSTHLHDVRWNDKDLPEIPEIVLVNSHDGTSAYNLTAGMYRQICANGLIVSTGNIDNISVRHSGRSYEEFGAKIIEGTFHILNETPKALEQINQWKHISLTKEQQAIFANHANEVKPLPEGINPLKLLTSRRYEDNVNQETGERDLYTTFNVIQENMIRGGVRGLNADNTRRVRSREVKAIDANLKVNKILWSLTDQIAKTIAA